MPSTLINSCNDTITQYNVQTGTALNTLNQVPPGSTSGVPLISQGASAQPIFGTTLVAGGGTGDTSFTPYAVITAGTTSTSNLQNVSGVGTSGQVLTSSGASALPTWQTASLGTTSFTTNVSGPVTPNAGVVTVTGTNVYSDGTVANTLTLNTQGAAHTFFVAQGTNTPSTNLPTGSALQVMQSGGASADPAWSTATYPATTTISQLLYSSANNVVAGLATANRAVITTSATGVPVATALATSGQLIIGSTSGAPAAATLTAGSGINIVNASNSITVYTFLWGTSSGNSTVSTKNAYFVNGSGILTLPAGVPDGDSVEFIIIAAATTLTIKGNTTQIIRLGLTASAAAGTCVSSDLGSSITLVYKSTITTWFASSSIGSWTIT